MKPKTTAHMTDDEVSRAYERTFGEPLYIPLQFGHGAVDYVMLIRCARIALDEGQPIDWSRYCDPLPDGAVS
jgi:hypothetical protein